MIAGEVRHMVAQRECGLLSAVESVVWTTKRESFQNRTRAADVVS